MFDLLAHDVDGAEDKGIGIVGHDYIDHANAVQNRKLGFRLT